MDNAIALTYPELALSGLLMLACFIVSWALQLGLQRDLVWGSIRTFIQLALVGYILAFLFRHSAWYWSFLGLAIMLGVAIYTGYGRIKEPLLGKRWIFTAAIATGSLLVLLFVTAGVLRISPWYDPRYLLPLAGMIISNAMNAVTVAVSRFAGAVRERRLEVETALSLGATMAQALRGIRQDSLRLAIMPSINSMLVVGIVSLPGMMTGQIIAGNNPAQAAHYQVVVMFMITAASMFACVIGVLLAARSVTTPAQQLRVAENAQQ